MAQKESQIEHRIRIAAQLRGWRVRKFTSPGRRGVPDRMFTRKGVVAFIEVKKPGETPDPLQHYELSLFARDEVPATWVDNVEDALKFLSDHTK